MDNGWFSVKHGITGHPLFKHHPERLAIWIWLLDNAAWTDTEHDIGGKIVTVSRGSVSVSERRIATEVGVGYQVVRTALERFRTEQMVNAAVTHGRNMITLCNYGKYQTPENTPNALPNASLTQRQRIKEQGKQKKKKDSCAFSAFWEAFPVGRKVGKKKCISAFDAAVKSGVSAEHIINAAKEYAALMARKQTEQRFIKNSTTWLNQGCWDDELNPGNGMTGPDDPRAKKQPGAVGYREYDDAFGGGPVHR